MAEVEGTFNADSLTGQGNRERDRISAFSGNDEVRGLSGNDTLYGGAGNDGIYGNEDNDALFGEEGADVIRGGDGGDFIKGGPGNDLLYGQGGLNKVDGQGGNDIIIALGEVVKDADTGETIIGGSNGFDTLTGGGGADSFRLLKANDSEGRLFVKGQKFALIKDFKPGDTGSGQGDKIVLPGSPDNYRAEFIGAGNSGTAIYYTEDPDIDISLGAGGLSIATGLAIEIPNQTALVAVLENTVARNMYNEDFYEYTGI